VKVYYKQWLLLITMRRIQDHLRRLYRAMPHADVRAENGAGHANETPAPDAQFEAAWELEWRENILQAALARVRQKANPKHYQVFDYCVLQSLPPAQVAGMLGLNIAQVYLAKHRMSLTVKRVAREIETELNRAAGTSP
jgi:RNA polymerase sigma-70 factor (ECF subfamily)